ncbi:MAG: carboxymuconolactone decarboxylase family protein [Woeseiaceae bacterium]
MTTMPFRMPGVAREELDARMAASYDKAMHQAGEANVVEVLANSGVVTEFFFDDFYGKLFHGGQVDVRYKEILRLCLSSTHGCRSCNLNNRHSALAAGLTETDIEALLKRDNAYFAGADLAVCELADQLELSNAQGQLTASAYAALRAHFDDAGIVELAMIGGVLCGVAKMLFALNLVQREAYCKF